MTSFLTLDSFVKRAAQIDADLRSLLTDVRMERYATETPGVSLALDTVLGCAESGSVTGYTMLLGTQLREARDLRVDGVIGSQVAS